MPVNTIVILGLALIVMIVLAVIFLGKTTIFGTGLSQCSGGGKFCTQDRATCEASGGAATPMNNCNDDEDPDSEGKYCCVKIS